MYKTPGYFTVDSSLGYEWPNYTASVDVKTYGEKYFVPSPGLGEQVAPGAPGRFSPGSPPSSDGLDQSISPPEKGAPRMKVTRRELSGLALALAMTGMRPPTAMAQGEASPSGDGMSNLPPGWYGAEKIAFVAYPGFASLDLAGPHFMLGNLLGATPFIYLPQVSKYSH